MHFAVWMVLVAALLPYLTVGAAKTTGGYDNASPRDAMERFSGWRRRADWAHRNHFEAFPPFAASVILAEMAAAPQPRIDLLAASFILTRLAYTWAYLTNHPTLRSMIWSVGLLCVIGLFILALLPYPIKCATHRKAPAWARSLMETKTKRQAIRARPTR